MIKFLVNKCFGNKMLTMFQELNAHKLDQSYRHGYLHMPWAAKTIEYQPFFMEAH